jgi:hypothetical protein
MATTYMTTLQMEFVIRAGSAYVKELELRSKSHSFSRSQREEYESMWSKAEETWKMLEPRLSGDLSASKRMSEKVVVNSDVPVYSEKVKTEAQRSIEILKRPEIGISCVNTFREGEICGHDRAHHFKVHGKKNPICREFGCACDNFTPKPKEKPFSNGLGLGFEDFATTSEN